METYLIILTLFALMMQFVMGFQVGLARSRFKILPPAITGNMEFERMFRAHQNTIEYMPMYLILIWLAGNTGGNMYWITIIGCIWIIARILYFIEYKKATSMRGKYFQVTILCLALLLITIIYNLVI